MALDFGGIDIAGILNKIWTLFIEIAKIPFELWNRVPAAFHSGLFIFVLIVSFTIFIYTMYFIKKNPDIFY